ncbi:hypothetical protein [Nocardiopsis valliformis]|uniref:hypothetical protein n=1 Tax=Nocardiopsis valliformis TaxID=239974 RepID=UPI00034D2510|nr:hypothetical protein [Nocardiopsis valliformis]
MQIVTLTQRPDLTEVLERPELNPGPELMFHDAIAEKHGDEPAEEFGDYQLALLNGDDAITSALYTAASAHHQGTGISTRMARALRQTVADQAHQVEPNLWARHPIT